MDTNSYKRRMLNGNKTFADNTIQFMGDNFELSPDYQYIVYENEKLGAIVNDEKTRDDKTILLKPRSHIDKGEIIEYQDRLWLIMEINEDEIYPILKVKLCNQNLKSVTDGSEIPVVAVGKRTDLDETKSFLMVTTNQISVYASYQKAKNIRINDKFTMNNRGYEIIGIDDVTEVFEGTGIVIFTVDFTEINIDVPNPSPTPTTPTDNGGWGDWT